MSTLPNIRSDGSDGSSYSFTFLEQTLLKQASPEQLLAIESVERGEHVFITGSAGVGKSWLVEFLKDKYSDLSVTATTGAAAALIGGQTYHSLLGVGAIKETDTYITILNKCTKKRTKWASLSRLLIDECSMFSCETFKILNKIAQQFTGSSLFFGGIQLILLGDFLQLPCINGTPLFKSPLFKNFTVVNLVKNFRCETKEFSVLLDNVRLNKVTDSDLKLLSSRSRCARQCPEEALRIFPYVKNVQEYNTVKLQSFTKFETFTGIFNGTPFPVPVDVELTIAVGVSVMLRINFDVPKGIVNGSMGIITSIDPVIATFKNKNLENVEISFKNTWYNWVKDKKFTGDYCYKCGNKCPFYNKDKMFKCKSECSIDGFYLLNGKWSNGYDFYIQNSFTHYPFQVAFAITAHKAQGLTIPGNVVVDLNGFAPGQSYVALSRATCLDKLYIVNYTPRAIKVANDAIKYYTNLQDSD